MRSITGAAAGDSQAPDEVKAQAVGQVAAKQTPKQLKI